MDKVVNEWIGIGVIKYVANKFVHSFKCRMSDVDMSCPKCEDEGCKKKKQA